MNRQSPLSVDNILRFLQLRPGGTTFSELQRGLRLRKSEQRSLAKLLAKLKKKKSITELSGGRLVLPSTRHPQATATQPSPSPAPTLVRSRNSVSGRLILHQDGYGFVVPDQPMPRL